MVAIKPKTLGRRMLRVVALAVPLFSCARGPAPTGASAPGRTATDPKRLFVIERSLNANVVVYDAVRGKDGRLDPARPVAAYWLMKADKGQREELNMIERIEAFGFNVGAGPRGSVTITLKALRDRPIRVEPDGKRVLAVTRIAGREAVLRRVFVQTEEGSAHSVKYIELFGEDLRDHKPVHERISRG